jgi:PAS domain S-box-containing protein
MTSIEKILIHSEDYIRKLFDSIPIPIYVWQHNNNDFILVDYNKVSNKGIDKDLEKKKGINASSFYKNSPRILKNLKLCFNKRINLSKVLKYKNNSTQEPKFLSIKFNFIPPDLVLEHVEDITQIRLAENKLKISENNLLRLNKELEETVHRRTKKLQESEENYRDLIDNLDVGFYQVTLDGKMLNHNLSHKKILGYDVSDSLDGKDVRDFWQYPEQRDEYLNYLLENDVAKDYICHSLTKDGKKIVVQLNSHVVRDKQGKAVRIDGTFKDVTDKYRLEKKLKESEEKFRYLFESSPFSILLLDLKGKIIDCNSATEKLIGYAREELIGNKYAKLKIVCPKYLPLLLSRLKKLGEGDEVPLIEVELTRKDGSTIWANIQSSLVRIGNKSFLQVIGHNLTERKKAEQIIKESEERYRLISENANDLIGILDTDFKYEYINQEAFLRVLGYTSKDIIGRSALEFVHPEDINLAIKKLRSGFESGEASAEVRFKHKKGHWIWIGAKGRRFSKKNGEPKALIISRDITQRKTAEEALNHIVHQWQTSFDAMSEAVFLLDMENKIIQCNKASLNLFEKLDYNNVIGRSCCEIMHGKSQTVEWCPVARMKKTHKSEVSIAEVKGKWLQISANPVFNDDKKLIGVVHVISNITELKRAEGRIQESEKRYREAYDRASFYKDIFAHDINNILQIMNSSAELISLHLQDSRESNEIENIANIIKKQVTRGTKLVNNVRLLSELEESEIVIQPTKAYDMLLKSIDYIIKAYNEKELDVQLDCSDSNIYVSANDLLQDVFENILINAVKYNENAKISIFIKISRNSEKGQNYVKFEFLDNGIGIEDKKKRFIFKRGNGESKNSKGMGLGLSLVSKIIDYYKGKIWVEDKVEGDYSQGSNFIILLPEQQQF